MNVLALDTCFAACSVAVGIGLGGPAPRTEERFEPMATGHAERLLPMLAESMAAASLGFEDLDRIAVTTGPGTFTGTRICIAAARALALAHDLPVIPLSSLEVMANHHAIGGTPIGCDLLVAMNANRGEAYVQLFETTPDLEPNAKSEPLLLSFESAAALGGRGPVLIVGSAASVVTEAAMRAGRDARAQHHHLLPRIGDALSTAAHRLPGMTPPIPLYLRPADAKPQDGKSLARVS